MGAVVAFAMSINPTCAQSPSFAQRIYQDKADCQFCHGPDGDGRGDPRSPGKAPDLHKTALTTLPGVALWTWEDNVSRFDRLELEALPWSEKP